MSTLEQDLAQLNFEYLMLARECARNNPMEAAWRFGVERKKIEEIAEFSVENIRELSGIARTVITVIPMKTRPKTFRWQRMRHCSLLPRLIARRLNDALTLE